MKDKKKKTDFEEFIIMSALALTGLLILKELGGVDNSDLYQELKEAEEKEDYEKCAIIRDKIKRIKAN